MQCLLSKSLHGLATGLCVSIPCLVRPMLRMLLVYFVVPQALQVPGRSFPLIARRSPRARRRKPSAGCTGASRGNGGWDLGTWCDSRHSKGQTGGTHININFPDDFPDVVFGRSSLPWGSRARILVERVRLCRNFSTRAPLDGFGLISQHFSDFQTRIGKEKST